MNAYMHTFAIVCTGGTRAHIGYGILVMAPACMHTCVHPCARVYIHMYANMSSMTRVCRAQAEWIDDAWRRSHHGGLTTLAAVRVIITTVGQA